MKQLLYRLSGSAAICLLLLAPHDTVSAQGEDAAEVVVLEATGAVVPPFAAYIERGIRNADERNAEALIIVLNTPGGSVGSTLDIVQDIRASDVPVIVFVAPRGAGAASAGLLITLAGHASAMAPETAIGASSPIGPRGEDLESTSDLKVKEFLSAQARSLAEWRGSDAVALANDAIYEARAVTSQEALDANLVDFLAEDMDDLLSELDGLEVVVNGQTRMLNTRGATTFSLPMSPLESALQILTNPNVIFLFLTVGVLLLIVEAWSPGGWVAGASGAILVGLSLYGMGVLPVNWLGLVFVVLALVLFVLEIKAPTHGILTLAGAASLAIGAVVLFNQPELQPFGQISIPLVIAQSILLGAIFLGLAMMGLRAQSRRPTTGYSALIGQIGRVTQDLNPHGMVQVWGERWRAESVNGQTIPADALVEVVDANGMRLRVRAASSNRDV